MRHALHSVFGRWEPPPWIRTTGRRAAEGGRYVYRRPLLLFPIGLAIAGLAAAYVWYAMRPTPHLVTFTVSEPGLTEYNDTGISSIKPLRVTFSESVAPLKNVKSAVTSGITLSPAVAGTWFWDSDKDLRFTPSDDWPVDGAFTVTIAGSGAIASHVTLEDYRFKFRSQPFAASIPQSQFYQDPVDPNLKKLVATVGFSHPVDTARFESEVSLVVAKDAAYLGLKPDSRNFTVAYDKFKLHAYVHSMPLAMPRDDTPMSIRVAAGVRAARGGNGTKDKLEATITVPGRASLRFSDARMGVVDNAKHEPEQILFIKSSSPVPESGFAGKIVVKLLPVRSPRQAPEDRNPYQWNSSTLVGEDVLAKAENVALSYVPSDEGGDTSHGFRFRAPVGRYIHVLVKEDVPGTGGYVSGKSYAEPVKVEPYPRALKFLGEGALLAPGGDRKVGFLVRDVGTVRIEIGRVLPNQLQHLAKAMWNFAKPDLYGDLEDSVVERFVITRDYPNRTPGKPAYDSVDLTKYLQDGSAERRGSFLLRIRAIRRVPGSEDDNAMEGGEYDKHGRPIEDRRLILVTDLGFFVKAAKDGSRDVFVQSIRSGLPVTGARVALVGANGLNAFTATTDATGKATFPATPRDFPREKLPQMVLVERDSDMAFMPFRTNRRTLETSRFDTGGVENAESAQQLSTYLFSDRGIYRPGETMHLGLITRSADWRSALAGLPVTVEIADPRGQIVSKTQLSTSAGAFDEVSYAAPVSAPTGTYFVVAYLTKDPRRRESIGNTTVRVQEFEPDRLKVQLDLSSAPIAGWLKPSDVHPRVTVAHLFGAAAGGRRVEGDLSLTPVLPRFTRYPDHRFQIGEVIKEPYQETLAALTTDDKGVAEFQVDLKRFVGRAYRLNLLTRAYEAGAGRNVAAQNSAIVSDANYLVGVKPDGDLTFVKRGSARQAQWLAVDQQLDPVAADNLFLEWVQRQFVSVLAQQSDGTLRYVSKLRETVRSSRPVAIVKGGSSLPLPTNEPGDFLLVLRDATGARLNSLNYSVAGDANISRSLDREAELQVQLDKASYNGGETIGVSIRAPYAGAGLITIERERVYRHQWFKTTTTSSVQRITLPPDFEGNGYVTVQFVRDAGSDELFVNPLSYGIAAFGADLGARTQPVTLNVPKLVKPGQTLRIRVAPGEPSRVAVLAVDEGILQVARYRSPDPLGYFFQKKMLEVQTSQVLDLILPDFARFLALAAPGGDADAGFSRHLNPFAKKRKAPVAYWSGIVSAGREGRELTYTVPDHFNGRLRIVAVSASARRVGVAETATEVRGDFILTPNVPASVTPGDEFIVSVGVYNNTTGGTGPIRVELQPGSGLSLVGAGSAELQIADRKEGVGEFRVKAGEVLGSAPMTFVARRAAAESRVVEEVGVRPAAALRTTLTLGRVDGVVSEAPVTRELYSSRRKVDAAISMTPLVWGQGLVAYLDAYEYSCTEQLLSRGFAALILYSRPEFGRVQSPTDQPLDATLAVIRARTNEEGGLGLWAATPESHEFATLYGAHFLVEARDRGRNIPQDVLSGMNDWLARFAGTPASSLADGRMRAYAVYLLARQGIRPTAAISNVEQELSNRYATAWPTDLAAAYLASTYRLMQRTTDADRIMRRVTWSAGKKDFPDAHGGTSDIYYGAVVHDAQLLYLQAKHFPAMTTGAPPPALEAMARSVSQSGATSLSASYVLMALDAYAKSTAAIPLGINEIGKDGQSRALTLPAGAMPQVPVSENAAKVQFTKRGQPPAFYVLAESGFDRRPQTAEVRQGVEILRDFVDDKGNVLTRVTVGQEFFVRLRLRALDRDVYRQVAVVDVLPGGVEPVLEVQAQADSSTPGQDPAMQRQANAARTLPIGLPGKSDWSPQHVDVRDDRVVLYGDANRNIGTFVYRVRANNAGTYQVPPAFAEGMYDRRIVALGRSSTLEVIKP